MQQQNNYREKIASLTELGIFQLPHVYDTAVAHDDWCIFYEDPDKCNCEPEIKVMRLVGDDKWEIVFVG